MSELKHREPDVKEIAGRRIRLVRGDLTLLPVDAIVHYARHDLVLGTGFGTAISVRGGSSIGEELAGLGPLETSEVVVSGAGDLPARRILHAVGPRFREPELETKLRRTLRNVLRLADEQGLATIAFPPMGAGFYGVPLADCARVMVEEIERHLAGATSLVEVVVCAVDRRELQAFRDRLAAKEEVR